MRRAALTVVESRLTLRPAAPGLSDRLLALKSGAEDANA